MPHLSSRKLSETKEKALKGRLVEMLRLFDRDRSVSYALKELLTHTESVMLAKRLGVVYLISKDKSTLDICETLNVSSSNSNRLF